MPRLGAALVFAALFAAPGSALGIAQVETGDGKYSIEAIGTARFTGAFLHYPDIPALFPTGDDGLTAAVLRLLLDGYLGPRWTYEVNLYADLTRSPAGTAGGAFSTAASFGSPYRHEYLSFDYWKSGSVTGELGVDRANAMLEADPLRIWIGRMAINYSVTQIFTPNDFFAPFSAVAINKIYKPGVDALRLGWATGMLSSCELAFVLGSNRDDRPAWGESALLLQARTVVSGWELGLLGGKLARRWVTGASLQGEAGPIGLRAEGHAGFPDDEGDGQLDDIDGDNRTGDGFHTRLAIGADYLFDWQNASLGAEYMYLSDGARSTDLYPGRALVFFPDDTPFLGRHYTGLSAGLDLTALLRLQTVGLLNAEDRSGLGVLSLIYNIADEAEALAGLIFAWGPDPEIEPTGPRLQSEFGAVPLVVFLETRFYF